MTELDAVTFGARVPAWWRSITPGQMIGWGMTAVVGLVNLMVIIFGVGSWYAEQKRDNVEFKRDIIELKKDLSDLKTDVTKTGDVVRSHDGQLSKIASDVDSQAKTLIQLHEARDKEVKGINDRAGREEDARGSLQAQIHTDMSELNNRFNEWLIERKSENAQRGLPLDKRRYNFPP